MSGQAAPEARHAWPTLRRATFPTAAILFALLAGVMCSPAHAAVFLDEQPPLGSLIRSSGMKTISLEVIATPGQTLAPSGSLSIDGGAAIPVAASYAVLRYEPYYDGEYGVWYDVPVFDTTRATYSTSRHLTTGRHSFTLTVDEAPSGAPVTYRWEAGGEACVACHEDQPGAHPVDDCAACHTLTGPVLKHNSGGFGGCGSCHGAHGSGHLGEHIYYNLEGDPSFREARLCTSCHSPQFTSVPQPGATHEGGPFLAESVLLPAVSGYLSWDIARGLAGAQGSTPHGGYTTHTNKCAVCHSVHQARPGGSVLTAYGPQTALAQGCLVCHSLGGAFTDVQIVAFADGTISPHATCTRCHAESPHGVGVSEYATLANLLLKPDADAFIAQDLSAGSPGLGIAMFDGTGDGSALARGTTLGTGYLCSACHTQTFSVASAGADPAGGGTYTGHRVVAQATEDWDESAFGGSPAPAQPIAWADADSCRACHDAPDSRGEPAFPHGYVDAFGAPAPKTATGASYLWLTTADDVTGSRTILPGAGTTDAPTTDPTATELLTNDGLCLKCHRDGSGGGVGLSF